MLQLFIMLLCKKIWEFVFCFFKLQAIQTFVEVQNLELKPVRCSVELAVKELEAKKYPVFLVHLELLSIESCAAQLINIIKMKESEMLKACELESLSGGLVEWLFIIKSKCVGEKVVENCFVFRSSETDHSENSNAAKLPSCFLCFLCHYPHCHIQSILWCIFGNFNTAF